MKKDKEKISVFAEEETIVKKDGEVIEEKIEVTDKFDGYDDEAEATKEQLERDEKSEADKLLPPDPEAILEVRHLKKFFVLKKTLTGKPLSTLKAVDDVSFKVKPGETLGIVGESGCGKTTLLNLILGLTQATSGKIMFDGEDLTNVSMQKRGFNIVFQDFALFPNLNAHDNIVYGLRNNPSASTPEEVNELIDLLGLRKHLHQRIDELSGGQKQRVAIARTLVLKPRILLLDEPLSALDGLIKESIKERIRMIARQFELTTLIVTHDPEEALTLSDRVLIINNGRIAQFADPMTIINKPADDFVNDFIISQLMVKRTNILKLFSGPNPKNAATLKAESGALA